jgi:hypothetical protein
VKGRNEEGKKGKGEARQTQVRLEWRRRRWLGGVRDLPVADEAAILLEINRIQSKIFS